MTAKEFAEGKEAPCGRCRIMTDIDHAIFLYDASSPLSLEELPPECQTGVPICLNCDAEGEGYARLTPAPVSRPCAVCKGTRHESLCNH